MSSFLRYKGLREGRQRLRASGSKNAFKVPNQIVTWRHALMNQSCLKQEFLYIMTLRCTRSWPILQCDHTVCLLIVSRFPLQRPNVFLRNAHFRVKQLRHRCVMHANL
jgi:hypothetical protein